MNKIEKNVYYAALLTEKIAEIFNEESTVHIDLAELEEGDNATQFIHALANLAPASIYSQLTGEQKNILEFNHLANQLCFKYANKDA